jgi:hypothetical protein
MTFKTLPKPSSTNRQVREYTSAIDRGYRSLFVIATDKGWVLKGAWEEEPINTFKDKAKAVESAKKLASTKKTSFYVFDKAGELVA